jgi:HPr kinase/phosphorylase
VPFIVVAHSIDPPDVLLQAAIREDIPVFQTPLTTTEIIRCLGDYLNDLFAPAAYVYGAMVDVYGIGVLITGRSGIGKSEIALDLVARGHRIIADDQVAVFRQGRNMLTGTENSSLKHHLEIRGLGIVDVQAIYGIRGVRSRKQIELQIELVDWKKNEKYERVGLEEKETEILGEKIPIVQLPIFPGKNISVIIEVIALNHLLKISGRHSARKFQGELIRRMRKQKKSS